MKTRKQGIFLIKSPCNLDLKVLECRKLELVDLRSGREPTLFDDKDREAGGKNEQKRRV